MAGTDGRGFEKTELVMFNPQAPNFQTGVNLVERDTCPNGFQLVDPDKSGKKNQFDLVELAAQVQTADQFTRATAGSKLQVIAEQVIVFIHITHDKNLLSLMFWKIIKTTFLAPILLLSINL